MDRTKGARHQAHGAIFLTLARPYKALQVSTVGKILNGMIHTVGLDGYGYSAKCFRPTRATRALGYDPDKVRHLDCWKTSSVFLEHYVHDKIGGDYAMDLNCLVIVLLHSGNFARAYHQ